MLAALRLRAQGAEGRDGVIHDGPYAGQCGDDDEDREPRDRIRHGNSTSVQYLFSVTMASTKLANVTGFTM